MLIYNDELKHTYTICVLDFESGISQKFLKSILSAISNPNAIT